MLKKKGTWSKLCWSRLSVKTNYNLLCIYSLYIIAGLHVGCTQSKAYSCFLEVLAYIYIERETPFFHVFVFGLEKHCTVLSRVNPSLCSTPHTQLTVLISSAAQHPSLHAEWTTVLSLFFCGVWDSNHHHHHHVYPNWARAPSGMTAWLISILQPLVRGPFVM